MRCSAGLNQQNSLSKICDVYYTKKNLVNGNNASLLMLFFSYVGTECENQGA